MSDTKWPENLDQQAMQRIKRLIAIGLGAGDDGARQGPWSEADFDELVALAEITAPVLPARFFELLDAYPYYCFDQRRLAERLDRALQIQTTYGEKLSQITTSELEPTFELDLEEKDRVLKLTGQIRKIVFASTLFDEPHKRRLLNRIAAIEKELHQPKGRLDVILAGVSDVGDTLKKFGGDLKPLTDRFSEIKKITQSKSDEYQQIPAPEDLEALPPPDDG